MKRLGRIARRAVLPMLAVLAAFLVGSVFLFITDLEMLAAIPTDPIGAIAGGVVSIGEAYYAMLIGAFGDPTKIVLAIGSGDAKQIADAIRPLTETLVAATPLIFCGLAVAVAFRSGVFNIGVEGQFIMGAMGATVAVLVLQGLPVVIHLPLVILFGTLTGAAWGFIPGFLKARTGAHEVITTIMLNLVALQLVSFGLRDDFIRQAGSSAPISKVLSGIVRIPPIFDLPAIRLHYGFIVALIMAVVVSWFLFKTTKGYELRAAGFSMSAARYAGISAGGSIILAMTLSGAIAGLGGSLEVIGLIGQMSAGVSANFGFSAIALALLAGNRPAGIVAAALLFGALKNGGGLMQVQTGIPLDLLLFIQALVIMFVAAPLLVRSIFRMKARPIDDGSPI